MWREFRRQRRYQREGRVIRGVVVAPKLTEGESDGQRVATLYLNYRITSPISGDTIHRMQQQRRDDLTQVDLPPEGRRLAVLYVDDRLFTVL